MFGKAWEKAEATIVLVHMNVTGSGRLKSRDFIADILPQSGPMYRTTIDEPRVMTDFLHPTRGDRVGVLINGDKVKFDKDDDRLSRKARNAAGEDEYKRMIDGL